MAERVVVLGAGYAGTAAIGRLERVLDGADLVWISDTDYHFVRHESHRLVRDPAVGEKISLPVEAIASGSTRFIRGAVTGLDTHGRVVDLADGPSVPYDYLLIALGSRTAFYGIPGVREHALTLEDRDDALAIHEAVSSAAHAATRNDPATVVVGGAGLSGIQIAGEVAAFREDRRAPLEITLVEALDEVLPGSSPALQAALRARLEARDVRIETGAPITGADDSTVQVDGASPVEYDVFVWTGGLTGRDALDAVGIHTEQDRVVTDTTFRADDDRVFAIGDAALIEADGVAIPPTAQAAWQAAPVAAGNLARAMRGDPLERWRYVDKGTLVSVGEGAVAHGIPFSPVSTFAGPPAVFLKKAVAARWIASVTGVGRAIRAWPDL